METSSTRTKENIKKTQFFKYLEVFHTAFYSVYQVHHGSSVPRKLPRMIPKHRAGVSFELHWVWPLTL